MLNRLKRAVLRSPIGAPARRIYGTVRSSPLDAAARRLARRLWPPTVQRLDAQYNTETESVMLRVLAANSVCLDIGAHRGSVLSTMVRLAPQVRHWAFEPLPVYATLLRATFPHVNVCQVALSDKAGPRTFQHAVRNPGYSGFLRRRYPLGAQEQVESITVEAARLDDLIPSGLPVRFIKVDVEGAELEVFRGGQRVLTENRPVVVFEHGIGSADYYGTRPEPVYDLLVHCGLAVTTMARWLWSHPPLTRPQFVTQFETTENFYFMAYPARP